MEKLQILKTLLVELVAAMLSLVVLISPVPMNFGGPADYLLTTQERKTIEKFQDDYFKQHKEYIQIRADKTLASDSKQLMTTYEQNNKLNINKDFKIHVFTDDGVKGYRIIEIPPFIPPVPFITSTSTEI